MTTKYTTKLAALCLVLMLPFTTTHTAQAQDRVAGSLSKSSAQYGQGAAREYENDPSREIEADLTYLAELSEDEFDKEFDSLDQQREAGNRVAPLVLVAALGCAVSVGSAIFNTEWTDGNSAAWALAGLLVGCVPGATQAKIFNVIVRNKGTIVKALKKIGATSMAVAIVGANLVPVSEDEEDK